MQDSITYYYYFFWKDDGITYMLWEALCIWATKSFAVGWTKLLWALVSKLSYIPKPFHTTGRDACPTRKMIKLHFQSLFFWKKGKNHFWCSVFAHRLHTISALENAMVLSFFWIYSWVQATFFFLSSTYCLMEKHYGFFLDCIVLSRISHGHLLPSWFYWLQFRVKIFL